MAAEVGFPIYALSVSCCEYLFNLYKSLELFHTGVLLGQRD